jgi:hypothetical protein
MYFRHLFFVNQSYLVHFKESLYFSFVSLKASFYFLCHAVYPDIFVNNGSKTIYNLNKEIQDKLNNYSLPR